MTKYYKRTIKEQKKILNKKILKTLRQLNLTLRILLIQKLKMTTTETNYMNFLVEGDDKMASIKPLMTRVINPQADEITLERLYLNFPFQANQIHEDLTVKFITMDLVAGSLVTIPVNFKTGSYALNDLVELLISTVVPGGAVIISSGSDKKLVYAQDITVQFNTGSDPLSTFSLIKKLLGFSDKPSANIQANENVQVLIKAGKSANVIQNTFSPKIIQIGFAPSSYEQIYTNAGGKPDLDTIKTILQMPFEVDNTKSMYELDIGYKQVLNAGLDFSFVKVCISDAFTNEYLKLDTSCQSMVTIKYSTNKN